MSKMKKKKKKETSTRKTKWKFRSLKTSSTVSRFLLCNKHIDFLCISYHKSVLNDADEDNVREYYLAKRGSYKNAFKPNFSSTNIRNLAFFTQFCHCWSFTKRRASTKSYIKALFYLFSLSRSSSTTSFPWMNPTNTRKQFMISCSS